MKSSLNTLPSAAIIIPTWNGLHLLKQSLDSFMKAAECYLGKTEVIIIDNGSMDRTVDVLLDYYPSVKVIAFDNNTGFGHACNVGAQSTECDLVFFLNNDIFVPSNIIETLVNTFQGIPDCFSVSPQTNYWKDGTLSNDVFSSSIRLSNNSNGELIQHWAVDNLQNIASPLEPTMYGTGAALLVDRKKFLELKGFDKIYGLAYWEDVDLCVRAWKNGWPSYYTNKSIAWHKLSASSSSGNGTTFKQRQIKINYIIFQLVHLPSGKLISKFIKTLIVHWTRTSKMNPTIDTTTEIKTILKKIPSILQRRLASLKTKSFDDIENRMKRYDRGYKTQPMLESELK